MTEPHKPRWLFRDLALRGALAAGTFLPLSSCHHAEPISLPVAMIAVEQNNALLDAAVEDIREARKIGLQNLRNVRQGTTIHFTPSTRNSPAEFSFSFKADPNKHYYMPNIAQLIDACVHQEVHSAGEAQPVNYRALVGQLSERLLPPTPDALLDIFGKDVERCVGLVCAFTARRTRDEIQKANNEFLQLMDTHRNDTITACHELHPALHRWKCDVVTEGGKHLSVTIPMPDTDTLSEHTIKNKNESHEGLLKCMMLNHISCNALSSSTTTSYQIPNPASAIPGIGNLGWKPQPLSLSLDICINNPHNPMRNSSTRQARAR